MAYRYEETQSAYLNSIRQLGWRIKELAERSQLSAQSSYFLALRALNHANNAKAILGK